MLELEFDSPVWVIDRVRTADDRPVVDSRDVIPAHLVGDKSPRPVRDGSLYDTLSQNGHRVHYGVAWIKPARPTGAWRSG